MPNPTTINEDQPMTATITQSEKLKVADRLFKFMIDHGEDDCGDYTLHGDVFSDFIMEFYGKDIRDE